MGFAGFESDPQRLVRAEQVLLADHFVDIAGPQAFGERNIGTGFFKHDVLGIISAFPDAVRDEGGVLPDGQSRHAGMRATTCIMTVAALGR